MSKKVRIPVTTIETKTMTAYVVFDVEGDTPEELQANINKLENLEESELSSYVDFSIKAQPNLEKYPPLREQMLVVHVLDADPF